MNKFIYLLLLFFSSILTISCHIEEFLPLEESDEEVLESINKLGNKIKEHNELEESVESKEGLVRNNQELIKKSREFIETKEDEVDKDIRKAIVSTGKKVPTKCINCNWTSSMTEESFDKLADKYHRGGFKWAKQQGRCEFWNSCPTCTKNEYVTNRKNDIRKAEETCDKLTSELNKVDKPMLNKSRRYIAERESSYKLMCSLRTRKQEIKQEINKEKVEKLEAQKKAAEKELENEKLKKENEQQTREIAELKKQQIEKKINAAKLMLNANLPIEEVMLATGLSKEEIKNLL